MNRKERRAAESQARRNGNGAPPVQTSQQQDPVLRLLDELLNSKDKKAPNEFIAYFVDQAKSGQNELNGLAQNIQGVKNQLQQMEQNLLRLQGSVSKAVEDARVWIQKHLEAEAAKAAPKPEAKPEAKQKSEPEPAPAAAN